MAHKKPLIPFKWMPGSWGLTGKAFERAKAEYELDGYDLEIALSILDSTTQEQHEINKINIDYTYGLTSERDFEYAVAKRITDDNEREIKLLKLDYQYTDMKDIEYDKRLATLTNEPWVNVIDLNVTDETGNFELDWNDKFVEDLKDVGFKGITDEEIVNAWFSRICRDIALSEFGGQGDFDEQLAAVDNAKEMSTTDENGRRIIK
jgi:hypothetical protein